MNGRWLKLVLTRRLALLPLVVLLTLIAPVDSATAYDCSTVPVGSWSGAASAVQHPIWCVTLPNTAPVTRQKDAQGGWLDDFNHGSSFAHFGSGDSDYTVYDAFSSQGASLRSAHWLHNQHWMVDMSRNNGGTMIEPNQAFRFENGQLVLETDVAAAVSGYMESNGGDIVWPEVLWSTASKPTGKTVDGLYLYGAFGGQWVGGCRLQAKRNLTCALEADHPIGALNNNDQYPCFGAGPSRLIEMSGFQQCGGTHFGGAMDFGAPQHSWRACGANDPDTNCRDRFRFVWRKDGLTAYVNGVRFFEDSGWPAARQIPDAIVNGSTDVYGYFGEWGDFSDSNVYRFHWDRVAVNPHDAGGALLPLSAAESFCLGQPNDTCAVAPPPTPTPSGSPSPTPTPTPSPTPTVTPTPVSSPFVCSLRYGGVSHRGTCQSGVGGTIAFSPS